MIFPTLIPVVDRSGLISILCKRCMLLQQSSITMRQKYSVKAAKKEAEEEEDLDVPIKYSTSEAAQWTAAATRLPLELRDRPAYERTVIGSSIALFLLYFCVFREENDLDAMLEGPLKEKLARFEAQNVSSSQK